MCSFFYLKSDFLFQVAKSIDEKKCKKVGFGVKKNALVKKPEHFLLKIIEKLFAYNFKFHFSRFCLTKIDVRFIST
jgi:hypothetical protein